MKNGVKMTPFVIGYLPQQYLTKDADLEVYAIIGTIGDIFAQNKLFTKGSTIDNIGIKKALDIMKITPEEAKFLNEFYQKTSKLDLKKPADKDTYNKLLAREEDLILNNLFKKWWKINPNWDGYSSKNKYIINIKLLADLMQELTYLKYH